jgi:hypothetical protein
MAPWHASVRRDHLAADRWLDTSLVKGRPTCVAGDRMAVDRSEHNHGEHCRFRVRM